MYVCLLVVVLGFAFGILASSITASIAKLETLDILAKVGDSLSKYQLIYFEAYTMLFDLEKSSGYYADDKKRSLGAYLDYFLHSSKKKISAEFVQISSQADYQNEESLSLIKKDFPYTYQSDASAHNAVQKNLGFWTGVFLETRRSSDLSERVRLKDMTLFDNQSVSDRIGLIRSLDLGLTNLDLLAKTDEIIKVNDATNSLRSMAGYISLNVTAVVDFSHQIVIGSLVIFRMWLWAKVSTLVDTFYFNLAMLSNTECSEIRKHILCIGTQRLSSLLATNKQDLQEVLRINRGLFEAFISKKSSIDRKLKEVSKEKKKTRGLVVLSAVISLLYLALLVINFLVGADMESQTSKIVADHDPDQPQRRTVEHAHAHLPTQCGDEKHWNQTALPR